MAARVGYCGLDRRREPLRGDEVRACWEDGAIALPPEPSIPGLLDLLTIHGLSDPTPPESEPVTGAIAPEPRPSPPVHRLRSVTPSRGWVEVDV